MSLFDPELPGISTERRSISAILYRLEDVATGPRVLVQSNIAPTTIDQGMATTTLEGLASTLRPGAEVQFRLDVNAVRTQSRTGRRLPVPDADLPLLLLNPDDLGRPGLLADALTGLNILEVTSAVRATGRTPLRVSSVRGVATIVDPEILRAKIIHGVGRGKSYGCGLLSVAPA